eukprot:TRINITY_DN1975_c0_g1_i1.p1 TRINITY_DN1975_c0_g1~~TRINITY_DN1975_c0_g1_i1.p1  ORF type:complete len:1151 (-),score=253.40 TRINITY_DN1975_c0_g1_i1:8-3460(-)
MASTPGQKPGFAIPPCSFGAKCSIVGCTLDHPKDVQDSTESLAKALLDQLVVQRKEEEDGSMDGPDNETYEGLKTFTKIYKLDSVPAASLVANTSVPLFWQTVLSNKYYRVITGARNVVMLSTIQTMKSPKRIDHDKLKRSVKETATITPAQCDSVGLPAAHAQPAAVCLVRDDSLDVAHQLSKSSLCGRVGVLSMASWVSPGGSYRDGTNSQEESLFRRTTYSACLDKEVAKVLDPSGAEFPCGVRYPYNQHEVQCIYSPEVQVLRAAEAKGYTWLSEPFVVVDVLSICALEKPFRDSNGMISEADVATTTRKIDVLFRTALMKGVDTLVLGALGCGVYNNPPKQIAALFYEAIKTYRPYFKAIVFAIKDKDMQQLTNTFLRALGCAFCADADVLGGSLFGCTTFPDYMRELAVDGTDPMDTFAWDDEGADNAAPPSTASLPIISTATPCKYGAHCIEWVQESGHLQQFSHPPRCKNGDACLKLDREGHMSRYLHPVRMACSWSFACRLLTDPKRNAEHLATYSHPCAHGSGCKNADLRHRVIALHQELTPCQLGQDCALVGDLQHCSKHSHVGVAAHRPLCDYGEQCTKSHVMKHIRKFLHPAIASPFCDIRHYNAGIDFRANMQEMSKLLDTYHGTNKFTPRPEIVDYVRKLRPVHRCNPMVFESMINMGALLSRDDLYKCQSDPATATLTEAESSLPIKEILSHAHVKPYQVYRWMKELVVAENLRLDDKASPEQEDRVMASAKYLPTEMTPAACAELKTELLRILTANRKLTIGGAAWHVDVKMKTTRNVFCVVGPHTGEEYGHIMLILSQSAMYHPDFCVTATAGTSHSSHSTTAFRPYDKFENTGLAAGDELQWLDRRRLHPAIPGWDVLCAAELQSMAAHNLKLPSKDAATLKHVQQYHAAVNHHFVLHGLLPGVVPLEFVERILIPRAEWDALSPECQQRLSLPPLKHRVTVLDVADPLQTALDKDWIVYRNAATQHSGFCLSLQRLLCHERVIPLCARQPDNLRLRFVGRGHHVRLSLSPNTEWTRGRQGEDCYNIAIALTRDGGRTHESWIRIGNRAGATIENKDTRFASHIPSDVAVEYKVRYKILPSGSGLVKVRYMDLQGKKHHLRFETPTPVKNVRHVLMSGWQDVVSYHEVSIE